MKKLLIILLATTSFVACKKDNDLNPGPNAGNSGKIKKVIGDSYVNSRTYDASGRAILSQNDDGSKAVYEYPSGKAIQKNYNAAGTLTETYIYDLNEKGLAVKETRGSDPSFTETKIYDNENKIIKYVTNSNGSASSGDFFYSNGNCDSIRHTSNGSWNNTVVYTYYTDKPNVLTNEQYGEQFYGIESKNMIKTEIYKYTNGNTGDLITYEFEFDAKGRVIKGTQKSGSDIDINYYSYE